MSLAKYGLATMGKGRFAQLACPRRIAPLSTNAPHAMLGTVSSTALARHGAASEGLMICARLVKISLLVQPLITAPPAILDIACLELLVMHGPALQEREANARNASRWPSARTATSAPHVTMATDWWVLLARHWFVKQA